MDDDPLNPLGSSLRALHLAQQQLASASELNELVTEQLAEANAQARERLALVLLEIDHFDELSEEAREELIGHVHVAAAGTVTQLRLTRAQLETSLKVLGGGFGGSAAAFERAAANLHEVANGLAIAGEMRRVVDIARSRGLID